jgi:UDP-3-O-[3-hydroxymyristoyl] N-acetylglucosamine deacetylase
MPHDSFLKLPRDNSRQHTLSRVVEFRGVGLHTGKEVIMRLKPAAVDTGRVFVRDDLVNGARKIPALWDHVVDTQLCTVLGNEKGARVGTVEHLMAAISALGIDNVEIEINAAEVPVMDGSAQEFIAKLEAAIEIQDAPLYEIEILQPIKVQVGDKFAELHPSHEPRFTMHIDFKNGVIGKQDCSFVLTSENFKNEISMARTFCEKKDIDAMQAQGLAQGGSLDNAVVIDGDHILNEEGLRAPDECVRHKLLDAVGDLALAGYGIRGHFIGNRTGHHVNSLLLKALHEQPSAWRLVRVGEFSELPTAVMGAMHPQGAVAKAIFA